MTARERRGVPLGARLIVLDRVRFAITAAGIGCAVALMLFLVALHDGVRIEANGYIASRPVHAWITQDNTTSFIKSSSFLLAAGRATLADMEGVEEVSPIIRVITTMAFGDERVSVIVLGIDPLSAAGRPSLTDGTALAAAGDLVLDRAFARTRGLSLGDSVMMQGRRFRVVGLSEGTNAVMTQFAFVSLDDARALLGIPQLASFFLVRGSATEQPDALAARLEGRLPGTNVFTQEEFASNNLRESQGGILPILVTVAVLGGIVALAVLSLLLYGAILEQRETYAVLKAIGASDYVLARIVVFQSLAAVAAGLGFGLLAYLLCAPLVVRIVPVLALALSWQAALAVAGLVTVIGLVGALLPLRRVATIHPAELFRA